MTGKMAAEQTSSAMMKAKRKTALKYFSVGITEKYFNAGENKRKFKNSSRTILMIFLNFVKIPDLQVTALDEQSTVKDLMGLIFYTLYQFSYDESL